MIESFCHDRNSALIAFQGEPGAFSDLASREVFPDRQTLPCRAFEDALAAVTEGAAEYAVIPIDNSVAGRVADVHHLLPRSGLYIIGEHFSPVHLHLLVNPGVKLADLKVVRSHVHALGQTRNRIRSLGLEPVVAADTAGSAADLARTGDRHSAAIASALAGQIYGLESLQADIEDEAHNTTRFVVLSARQPQAAARSVGTPVVTTFTFRVRSVPAALYKALGGFATNGINMTKLESYMVGGSFEATEFYADVEAHPDERRLQLAFDELGFFTDEVKMLGTYPGGRFPAKTTNEREHRAT